ncbi:ABC transporter ATP-binding protein [Brachybacterium sp. DNPG3]
MIAVGHAVPQPPRGTRYDSLRALPAVLVGWRPWFALTLAWNLLVHLAAALAAGGAAWAVAAAVRGAAPEALWAPTLLVLGATLVRSISQWQESYTSHDLSFRVMARIRIWVFDAVARVAPGGLAGRRRGDLTSTVMNDAEALEVFLAHSSLYRIGRFLATPLILAGLALISPVTALAVVPFVLLLLAIPAATRRAALRDGAEARELLAAMASQVQEDVGAVREIVAFDLREDRRARLEDLQRRLTAAQSRTVARTGLESAVAGVATASLAVVATAVGAVEVSAGRLDLVMLPVVVAVAAASPSAVLQWISTSRHTGNTAAAARRIEAILEAEPLVDPVPGVHPVVPAAEPGIVLEARDLAFSWPGAPRPAVDGISLVLREGEQVAIAGASGSGKSTLAQLLARWQEPAAGRVLLDGADVRDMPLEELRERLRMIEQEPHLFAESIRENLLLAAPFDPSGAQSAPDDAELRRALARAGALATVDRLPDGLDTVLADHGASLSGGERQRIALARAFLRPGQVLVLDEAVSQLDTGAALSVQRSVATDRRTTLVIAHRLVTLLHADRILVLEDGRLVDDGTHEELMERCAAYRALVEPQLVV